LELPQAGSRPERVAKATETFDASIEAAVRRNPEQWLWVHRRWKLPREWRR
jgi:KDO2-lipid IV(A) lauroyltransferase